MNIPYLANGIYPSEVAIVVEAARRHGIDLFLESGVDNGYSTECWAMEFTFPILAVDCRPLPETVARLKRFPHLTIEQGYASPFMHAHCRWANSTSRIGVFLDGPKYEEAADLAQELMVAYQNVQFVAIHDALDPRLFEAITFVKTLSVDTYGGEAVDVQAHEFNRDCGVVYSRGPGLLLVER